MFGTASSEQTDCGTKQRDKHDDFVLMTYEGELLAGREAVLQLLGRPVLAAFSSGRRREDFRLFEVVVDRVLLGWRVLTAGHPGQAIGEPVGHALPG